MTDHRYIDVSNLEPVTPAEQAAPQLCWIPIGALVIDTRYQRPLGPGNIKAIRRIAGDFRWSRFSPLLVAPIEGGLYAIIDGQHRAHAAALCGYESVPAMIALVPPAEQALAFIEINTAQIRVRSNGIYRAALTAGETWALRCQRAVENAGCTLMTYNVSSAQKKPGQVFAVGLIKSLIEKGHDLAVTAGLRALMAYDATNVPNFSDALLDPWLSAIAETGHIDQALLLRVLQANRPWIVIEQAERIAKSEHRAAAPAKRLAFSMLIRRQYAETHP